MELVRAAREWWQSRENLADLVGYLREYQPDCDFEYLLRKPWKWQSAYEDMRRFEEQERLADERDAFEANLGRRSAL